MQHVYSFSQDPEVVKLVTTVNELMDKLTDLTAIVNSHTMRFQKQTDAQRDKELKERNRGY